MLMEMVNDRVRGIALLLAATFCGISAVRADDDCVYAAPVIIAREHAVSGIEGLLFYIADRNNSMRVFPLKKALASFVELEARFQKRLDARLKKQMTDANPAIMISSLAQYTEKPLALLDE
ncbi:MAG: hypothetical protein A3I78_10845 [Gammaproteobacteria bacterium RIFCSPLOWO2_02_FULL_56_15]|nr:MAG: hypothetical protein A3I78_10845 [Gammaproteobacteria bacterium RIFCSPLOWO2_02_FULL_56_15]